MKKYRVNVTRRLYKTGTIEVFAENEDMAYDKACEVEIDETSIEEIV